MHKIPELQNIQSKHSKTIKAEIDSSTIMAGGFNSQLLAMDRSTRQNIKKGIKDINNTTNQLDSADIENTTLSNSKTHIFQVHNAHTLG